MFVDLMGPNAFEIFLFDSVIWCEIFIGGLEEINEGWMVVLNLPFENLIERLIPKTKANLAAIFLILNIL